jgi:hypothetical protein
MGWSVYMRNSRQIAREEFCVMACVVTLASLPNLGGVE